jgi:uncharacterized protein YukE
MSLTSLTHAQAQAKMNQVDEAMNRAHQLLQHMEDRTQQMCASSWLGCQSISHQQRMQGHSDNHRAIVQRLQNVVDNAKANMMTIVNADSE